jgi:hypothetical protein
LFLNNAYVYGYILKQNQSSDASNAVINKEVEIEIIDTGSIKCGKRKLYQHKIKGLNQFPLLEWKNVTGCDVLKNQNVEMIHSKN